MLFHLFVVNIDSLIQLFREPMVTPSDQLDIKYKDLSFPAEIIDSSFTTREADAAFAP